jgi:putative ABC transport system permease protein
MKMRWRRTKDRQNDLDRELRADLELEAEEQKANGLSTKEAQQAAHRSLGNVLLIKEQTCEVWGWLWIERHRKDLRYAIRGLRRDPLFTLAAVLSLALGVGVTTSVFGAFEALFLNSVSAHEPGGLRHLEPGDFDVSYAYYQYLLAAGNLPIRGLAAYSDSNLSFGSGANLESVSGDIVSSNFFAVLGIAPAMGRGFLADEQEQWRQPQVAILSHSFWQRKLGAAPDVLGKTIELNHEYFTVIGVLPEDYRSVHGYGMSPEVYVPFSKRLVGHLDDPGSGRLRLIARVQDGVTHSQLKASLGMTVRDWRRIYPADARYSGAIDVYPLAGVEKMRHDGVPMGLTLFLAFLALIAGLFLLIACANVGGLLVARGLNRTREIAVRLALGATRYRLMRQLLTESALLAFLGTSAGIVLYFVIAAVAANLQVRGSIPFELHLRLDLPVLYFSIALVAITTALSGLLPAVQATRDRWYLGSNQIGAETRQRYALRRGLVTGQFALAFVLLISAALFLRSLAKSSHVDPGFNVQHLVTAGIALDPASYPPARSEQYLEKAIAELGSLPGVLSVSGAAILPLGTEHWVMSMKAADHIVPRVFANSVTPRYFQTMQIQLLQGRDFVAADRADGAQVAIVNETFAKDYFQSNALDKLVYLPIAGAKPTFSPVKIIGVASDSKYGSLGEAPMPALYLPFSQSYSMLNLEISTESMPAATLEAVRRSLTALDPHAPIKIELMQERLAGALLPAEIASFLLSAIGALGLLLAMVGIYGAVAYSAGQRTAEIGVRMALGATKANVLRLILRDAAMLVYVGLGVGSVLALMVVQVLRNVVPAGMSVVDPLSFVAVGGVLTIVALTAAYIPAWKASRVDPMLALRCE